MNNKNKKLLILFTFLLFFPLATFAGTKNISENCTADAECITNKCATSSLTTAQNKFCVCATPTDCENKYKKDSADETWTCEPGAAKSKNLPFCNSNKRGIQDPITASTGTTSTPEATAAATTPATYITTPPVPSVKIPGLPDWAPKTVTAGETTQISYIAEYIVAIYKYGLIIASMLAVIMIMIGGIIYLTAAGASSLIGTAKNLIFGAISGLVLLLGSYLLLMTINPNIVNLQAISVQTIVPEEFPKEDLPAEYSAQNDQNVEAEASGAVPPAAGDLSQKKFFDKCGDPATLVSIANKFLAQPVCQGPCHCAPTMVRWLIQSGCTSKSLAGAGLVTVMKQKLYNTLKHPNGNPMYIERSGDDTANLSPGDMVFFGDKHVGMYYGDGYVVDSGTSAGNQAKCFSSGCPSNIWDSYGTTKCAFCGLIPGETPADWHWARGILQKDLVAGNKTQNICYHYAHNQLTQAEKEIIKKKLGKACNPEKSGSACYKLFNNLPLEKADKKIIVKGLPTDCSSCTSNQCVAKNKIKGIAKVGGKGWGFDSYADYQAP